MSLKFRGLLPILALSLFCRLSHLGDTLPLVVMSYTNHLELIYCKKSYTRIQSTICWYKSVIILYAFISGFYNLKDREDIYIYLIFITWIKIKKFRMNFTMLLANKDYLIIFIFLMWRHNVVNYGPPPVTLYRSLRSLEQWRN